MRDDLEGSEQAPSALECLFFLKHISLRSDCNIGGRRDSSEIPTKVTAVAAGGATVLISSGRTHVTQAAQGRQAAFQHYSFSTQNVAVEAVRGRVPGTVTWMSGVRVGSAQPGSRKDLTSTRAMAASWGGGSCGTHS